jgi:hypothetical protein
LRCDCCRLSREPGEKEDRTQWTVEITLRVNGPNGGEGEI